MPRAAFLILLGLILDLVVFSSASGDERSKYRHFEVFEPGRQDETIESLNPVIRSANLHFRTARLLNLSSPFAAPEMSPRYSSRLDFTDEPIRWEVILSRTVRPKTTAVIVTQ